MEIGKVCMKIAGRDAGRPAIIIEVHKDGYVTIDGYSRRKKVNPQHLQFIGTKVDIKKGATHETVLKALEKLGFSQPEKSTFEKKARKKSKKSKK
ncbi:MAG: 50S ribosomal protein L14e [uncultured DHVE6 group euryarchaeote]|jgi:large subunit ribosomal protein L14e|nr:MAG: 50S ribosomal protein L14e [uncultured DHVE6 group euryarchaeote]